MSGTVSDCSEALTYLEDSTSPTTEIVDAPPSLTGTATAEFTFSGTDTGGSGVASFQCRLDSTEAADWASCSSPKNYSSLADGSHSFEVHTTDLAGNVDAAPASFTWTIDTSAPVVTIDSGPTGLTNDATPTFTFSSEPGASFECSIDTGTPSFGPCSGIGTHTPATPLSDGSKTFRVKVRDGAQNEAVATQAFQVDTASPAAPHLDATVPASPANANSPKILGSAPAGSTVHLYGNSGCNGTQLAAFSAAELAAGVMVSVADDSFSTFSAVATSPAAVTSPCSIP